MGQVCSIEVSGLEPDLIIDLEWGELGFEPVFHELLGEFVSSKGLISYLFLVFEVFFYCGELGVFNDVGDGLGFVSKHEVEW